MGTIQQRDDAELLRRYVEDRSEEAFRVLMERHLNFVYSVCRLQVRNADLAEDVTQAVFLLLARKASSIRDGNALTAWLFKATRFAAGDAIRREARRRVVEWEAIQDMMNRNLQGTNQGTNQGGVWDTIEPLLGDGIAQLAGKDREAILLRYFQHRSFLEVGHRLGTSEDAARLRVARATEKLKSHLRRHGVTVPSALLVALLWDRAAQAAPESYPAAVAAVVSKAGSSERGNLKSDLIGSRVAAISRGAMRAMYVNQIKATAMIVGLTLWGSGAVLLALTKLPLAKLPLAKLPLAKLPLAKLPLAKLPLAKLPLAKLPLAKLPLAKLPLAKLPGPTSGLASRKGFSLTSTQDEGRGISPSVGFGWNAKEWVPLKQDGQGWVPLPPEQTVNWKNGNAFSAKGLQWNGTKWVDAYKSEFRWDGNRYVPVSWNGNRWVPKSWTGNRWVLSEEETTATENRQ